MSKNKKPTMMEVKTAINNILVEMSHMSQTMRAIDSALASYVEFKGDEDKWRKWVQKKMKEANGKSAKSSNKGNRKTKKAK
jgi:hypothetical protein